ncbi:MAG: NADPH-dependent FMN reductase [Acidimicrobiales bacterium]|nr:NADPH-dependent FMN reductase [Acidimicrobiales bacterium]
MPDLTIAAVIGSLKAASVNRAVFEAAGELMPHGVELVEAPIAAVPLFNEDVEAVGDPAPVVALKDSVAAADGLIIFTPEYNGSMPGVTKNAVDWLSRPFLTGPIAGTPVGLVAATPGRRAGVGVREHLALTVAMTGGSVHEETHGVGGIHGLLTDGALTDEEARTALRTWIKGFVAFVHRQPVEG